MMGGTENLSEASLAAVTAQFEDMAALRPDDDAAPAGRLFVGEADLTKAWTHCAAQTGYTRPVWVEDPQDELVEKQHTAEASAAWAACAREHGYPATKDPAAPVADGWATHPVAVLPASITAAELQALLEDCPTFDREARLEADKLAVEDPRMTDDDYWQLAGAEAAIGFDVPCKDGSAAECDEATWSRFNPLLLVIEEQTNAYLRELNQAQRN
jgi:hypothetical protein